MGLLFGRKKAIDYSEDFYCDYFSGGGMDGGRDFVSLTRDKGKAPILEYSITRFMGDEPKEGKKEVPEEAVRRICEIYGTCGIAELGELKRTDLFALDAPRECVNFSIGGTSRSIDC